METNEKRRAIWRKWDLQIQTYLDPRWTWPDNYPAGDEKETERQDKFNVDLINIEMTLPGQ